MAKDNVLDDRFDRTNKYDFAGRLTFNQFGMGLGSNNSTMKRVYEQAIGYDAFSMMTSRQGVHWAEPIGFTETYSNGRITNKPNMTFDAAGNITNTGDTHSPEDFQNTTFDASGRRTSSFSSSKGRRGNMLNVISEHNLEYEFDGDGRPVIEREGYRNYQMNSPPSVPLAAIAKGYQIWSSVLGSSLTDIDVMGNNTTTKVFAGGAVIARQQKYTINGQTTTSATWTTADPVTGTVINFGAAGSDKEEYEPLGQQLELQDTADDMPEPPDNQPPKQYGALEPEWQCGVDREFYGGFSGMPFHCQKAILQDLSQPLKNLFPKKESSPIYLNLLIRKGQPNLPHADTRNSVTTKLMMSRAISSTSKKTGDGGGSSDGCTFDKYGNKTCSVNVLIPMIDFTVIPGFDDTSVGGDDYYTPTSKELEDRFNETLADKDCNTFLDKVRDSLDIDKTFQELLKDALNKGPKGKKGILYDPNQKVQELSGSGNDNQIGLRSIPIPEIKDPKILQGFLSLRLNDYVQSVIHALIHRAGEMSHSEFAEAADGALSASEREADPRPRRGKGEKDDDFDRRYSLHFQKILRLKCPGIVPKN